MVKCRTDVAMKIVQSSAAVLMVEIHEVLSI